MANILVIGGGLIGCGWAAAYAGTGHDVVVVDPDVLVADRLEQVWKAAQPVMTALGSMRESVTPPRHVLKADQAPAADLVQEALPEDLRLKHNVLAELEQHIRDTTPIASSSSGFTPDMIACGLKHPERLFIAHPCNPPYLMPTVELVGQSNTPSEMLEDAEALYKAMGKTVLRMAKPMRGHLVNRLQFALWREAVHLVATGAATMTDVERAISEGLAPRWCLMGPGGVFHLSGGDAGMAGYVEALGPATTSLWNDLGTPNLDTAAMTLTEGMTKVDPRSVAEITTARDVSLPKLMRALKPIKENYHKKGE
jgi:3-hydroxyacyl-CoA dehydrogenase